MCVMSMVMEAKADEWRNRYWPPPYTIPAQGPITWVPLPTQQEVDEFRRLLERARIYDREHNQPDCEMEDKRRQLKEMAEKLGVAITFV